MKSSRATTRTSSLTFGLFLVMLLLTLVPAWALPSLGSGPHAWSRPGDYSSQEPSAAYPYSAAELTTLGVVRPDDLGNLPESLGISQSVVFGDQLDQMLLNKERMLMNQWFRLYPVDTRYDHVFSRIGQRLNRVLPSVFSNSLDQTRSIVMTSNLGFNAVAIYRTIIFDTLLLDVVSGCSLACAISGSMDNEYSRSLCRAVAKVGRNGQFGYPVRSIFGYNTNNPYGIQVPRNSKGHYEQAEVILENTIACILCHEISHCYLGHNRRRLEELFAITQRYGNKVPQQILVPAVSRYMKVDYSKALELQADYYGAVLASRAGYKIDGFENITTLIDLVEAASGSLGPVNSSHPPGNVRMRRIRQGYADS